MITVFYARFAYLNPGIPLFLKFFEDSPPDGIRAVNVSTRSPDEVSRLAAESSTIAIDQSIEDAATWAGPGRFSIYRVRGNLPTSFYAEVSQRLWSVDARRMFMSNFDLHDVRIPALLEQMRGRVDGFSWVFEKRPLTRDQIPEQYRDPWLTPEHDSLRVWNLVREIAPIRVELPFSLAPHEFERTSTASLWEACVPGAPYATRTLATSSIKAAGLRCAPTRTLNHAGTALSVVLSRLLPSETASLASIFTQQHIQRTVVRSCAASFVCGSGMAFPTRKFFEVPGLRCPMLAYPCVGFSDYGFEHGVNCIATVPEEAGNDLRSLRATRGTAEQMARKCQEMIRRLHALEIRARDYGECLRRFDKDKLSIAEFRDGAYTFC